MFADFLDFRWVPWPMTEWWFMIAALACVGLFVGLIVLLVVVAIIRNTRK